jgi:hypothetical protein
MAAPLAISESRTNDGAAGPLRQDKIGSDIPLVMPMTQIYISGSKKCKRFMATARSLENGIY